MSQIGNEILEYRTRHNLSQEKMAELLKVNKWSICNIENGKQNPRKTLVMRFELLKKGEL